ncbi:transmembrane protein [Cystoisospora suis]|uniref:Transmembrane protein n=1 Tax=Cystoisospora suis TaxID=483139 RepID=A0A2C6L0S5_9APIC|nr:transmembrane protein [Cystoisospora suis]
MFQLMKDTGMDLHDPIYASLLKAISKTPSSPSSSSSLSLSSLSSSLPLLKRDKHLPSSFFSSFSSFPPLVQSLLLLKAMLKRHPSIHSPSSSSYHFDPPSSSRVDIRCFNYALTTAARHHPQRSLHFSHSPSSSLSSSSPSSSSLAFSSSSFLHLHRSLGSISKTSKPSEAFQLWRAMQEKVEEEASTKKRKEKKTTDEGEEGEGVEELEGEGAWSAEWIVRQLHASEGLVRPNSITLTTALQAFRNANNTPLSPLLKSYLPSSSSLATSYEGVPQLKSLLPSSSLYNPKKEDSFSSSSSSTYSQERPVGGSLPPSHFGRNRPLREAKEEEEGEEEEVSCSKEREERRVATAGEGRSFFVRPQMIDIPLLNALIHCKAIEGDLEGIEAILDMKRPIQDIVEEDEEKSQDLPRGEEIRKKKNGKILQIYGMFDDVTFKNLLFAASKAHRPHKSEEYLERQIAHGIPPGIQHWNQLFKAYVGRLRDISEGVQEEGGQEEKNTRHLGRERRGTGRESSNRRKEEGHEEGRKEGEEKGRDVSTKEVLHGEEKRNGEKKMAEEINFSESSMSLDEEEEEVRKLISRVIEVYRHLNTDGPFPGMKTFLIVNRALASGVSAARQVMLNQKRKPSSSSFSPFASSFLSTLAKKAAETSVQVARDYQQSLLQGNLHTQLTTLLSSSSSSLSSSVLREKVPRMGVGERLDGEEVSDRIEVYWQLFFNPWIFGEAMKACLASPPRRWGRTKAGGGGGEEGKDREVLEIFLDLLLPARNQFLRSFFHREKIFSSLHAETTKRTKEKEKTNLTEEEEERESLERKEALRDMNHQQDLAVSLSSPREEEDEEEEDKKEMDKYLSLLPPSLGLLPIGICELLIEALKNLYRRFSISNKESFLSLEEDREEEEEEKKKKIMNDREIDRERREKKDDEEEEPVKRRRREKEREEVKILMKKAFIAMLQEWSRKIFTLDGGLHRIYEDLFLEGEDEEKKKKMKSRSGDSKGILSSASWHTEESQEGKKKRWSERRSDEDEGKSALKEEKARKKIERNIKEKMNLVRLPTELLPFDIRQEETEENEEDEEEDGGFSDERARKLLKEKSRKEREGSKQNTLASQEEGEEEFPFSSSSSFISRAPSIGMKLKRRLLDQLRSSSSFDEAKSVYGELHYYGQEERMFTLGPGDREVLYRHLLRLAPHPVDALSFYISLPSHSKRRSIMTSSKRKDLETFSRKAHSSPLLRQPSTQHDEKKSGDIFFNSTKEREERERTAGEEARDHTGEAIVEEEQEKERKEEEEEWAVVTSSSSPVERVPLSFLKAAIGKAIEVARQSEKESGRLLDLLPFLLKSPYPSASFLSPCLCLKILEHLAKSETSPSSSSSSFSSSSSLSSSSLFSSAREKKDRECGGGGGETGDGILQFLEKSLEVLYVLHDDHEDGERKKKKNVSDLLMKEEEGGEEELSITRKDLELSAMRALGQTGSWRQAISLLHLRLQSLFGSPSSLSSSSPSFSSSSSSLSSLSILSSSAWSSPPPLAWWIEAKRAAEKAERPEIAKSLEILTRYKFAVGKEEIEKDRKKTEKEEEKILKSLLKEFLEGEGDARDKEDAFLKKLKKNQMMNSDLLASVVKKALEEEKKKKYMGSRAEDKPSLFHIAEKLSTDRDKSEEEDHEDLMKEKKKKKRDFLVGGGEEEEGEKRSKKNIFGEEVSKYTVLYKLEKLLDLPDLKKRNPYGDTIKRKSNKPKIKKKKKNKEE